MYTKQIDNLKYEVIFESEEELNNFKTFMNPPKALKAAEVMKLLDITRVTLCHYVKRGLIEIDTNYTGKQYRYNAESVYRLKGSK